MREQTDGRVYGIRADEQGARCECRLKADGRAESDRDE